jgi:hypothetical protein
MQAQSLNSQAVLNHRTPKFSGGFVPQRKAQPLNGL